MSVRCLRDGVTPSELTNQLSGVDFSVKSLHNSDGSRTDIQQVIGIDGWSMEGLSVALGTHGAAVARTTFDNRGVVRVGSAVRRNLRIILIAERRRD